MEQSMLFGDKKNFAVEIERSPNKDTYKLRFWVKNMKIGLFNKASDLRDSIKTYKKFIANLEEYYDPIIDDLKPDEIPFYLFGRDRETLDENVSKDESLRRTSLYISKADFGEQFYSSGNAVFILFKKPFVNFVICKQGILGGVLKQVELKNFTKIFEEYMQYCEANKLV